ncbi:alpha/beta hydrolase [Nocardioides sp. BP30]|uniref:alpha/beta hydrolase n=1 Tax=Nocardioides sp. BP30 TaxID=3036374 RepID=UPI0024689C83|nr:alpha/beta hydrolase [Nocardioides sp. BP30]WGL51025.1 alpha/beta hydrolase [Nocardioides sp. BP30]
MSADPAILTEPGPQPDAEASYGPEPDQVADLWRADRDHAGPGDRGDRPLLVMLHGGFWRPATDRMHTRRLGAALRAAGWSVVVPEYRRVPGDPDTTTADVRAALAALPELIGHRPSGVVVLGHSAGGHLALWSAAAAPARDLVLTVALAPVADLVLAHRHNLGSGAVTAFLGTPPELRADLDPVRLAAPATPVEILHGTADDVVPLALGSSYAGAHPDTRLHALADADHFDVIDPGSAVFPRLLEVLGRAGV